MHIQRIANISSYQINTQSRVFSNSRMHDLLRDTVSFSSKKDKVEKPICENALKGLQFGKELEHLLEDNKFDFRRINEAVKQYGNIEIKNISDLPKEVSMGISRNAYLLPEVGEDFALKKLTLFLPQADFADDKQKICFISSASHEFTHAMQRMQSPPYAGFKNLCDGSIEKARVINAMAANIQDSLSFSVQNAVLHALADRDDVKDVQLYKTIFPRPYKASEQKCLELLGFKSYKDFKTQLNTAFALQFDAFFQDLSKDEELKDYMPLADKPAKLRSIVKKEIVQRCLMEAEAYEASAAASKRIMGFEGSATNDMIPLAQKLVARALD